MYPVLRKFSLLAAALIMITACAETRTLMPTPNLYVEEKSKLFGELPKEFTSTHVEMIYVTDRAPEKDKNGNLHYGYKRSNSVAIGTTVIDLGQNTSWGDLLKASRTHSRFGKFALRTVSTEEFLRLPDTPTAYEVIDGKVVEDAEPVKKIFSAT